MFLINLRYNSTQLDQDFWNSFFKWLQNLLFRCKFEWSQISKIPPVSRYLDSKSFFHVFPINLQQKLTQLYKLFRNLISTDHPIDDPKSNNHGMVGGGQNPRSPIMNHVFVFKKFLNLFSINLRYDSTQLNLDFWNPIWLHIL